MIDVRVTIGIYEDLSQARVFRMKLGSLPRIGESVLLSGEIKEYEKQRKKEWKLPDYERINYVKNIAYDQQDTPILMLSGHPGSFFIDFYVKNEHSFTFSSKITPKKGEMILPPEGDPLYVAEIYHTGNGALAVMLSDTPQYPGVNIENNSVDVVVQNSSLDVYLEGSSGELDVNVRNRVLDVDVKNRYLYVESTKGVFGD